MVEFVLRDGIRYNICVVCGKEFRGRNKGKGNFYKKTCSPECKSKNDPEAQRASWTKERKEYMSNLLKGREVTWTVRKGKDAANWKGGRWPIYYIKYAFETLKLEKTCHSCGSKENLCVHHIDENRTNNEKENLIVLCKACHTSHHSKNNALWKKHLKESKDNEK